MSKSRQQTMYENTTRSKMKEQFAISNIMNVPVLKKIVINMGVAEALTDKNVINDCAKELALIVGQKPVITKSKKAISNFKLREDQPVGVKVTLRRTKMYDFMYRFCNIASPRIRDFRGFKKKGDGRGSYTLGLNTHEIFPELNLDDVKRPQGMDITFVTSSHNEEECLELLSQLGLPFVRKT